MAHAAPSLLPPHEDNEDYGQHVGNFTPLGGDRKIPARRGLGSNLGPHTQEGRTLGSCCYDVESSEIW